MLVVWSALIGVLLFLGLVVITLLLGAAARGSEKEAMDRTEQQRQEGVSGDVASDTPAPLHERYVSS